MKIQNVVLGGGIAGVAAAYRTAQRGGVAIVFEGSEQAGGLLKNFTIDGFRFDTAVHLSFATETEVREVFDRAAYHRHQPQAVNWDQRLWLKHPVQNNLYPLSSEEKADLVGGLVEAPTGEITNYREWLIQQYGEPIAARWPLIYTEKYWTIPADMLGTEWIGVRMRRADLKEVLRGAFTDDTEHGFYAKEMRYPKEGGYKAFMQSMLDEVEVRTGHKVEFIDPRAKLIRFATGKEISYERLVSTLPLPEVIKLMPDVPAPILDDAGSLFATQVDLISVGFNKPRVSPTLWFYIYDTDIWAARGYAPDLKSPDNVPEGCSSIQFEIYSSKARPQTRSPEELKENTLNGILKMQLCEKRDIRFMHHTRLPFGNVVFDLGMEERRDRVREWLKAHDIEVAGRFGEWAYLWSNQSMLSGMRAADAVFV